jgi:hypothetical protein
LFFLAAQLIDVAVFRSPPSLPVVVGGALIIAGGLLDTFWQGGVGSA